MADVSIIKKTILVPAEIDHVNLVLSMDEAQTLFDVLRRVGGEPNGRRKHISRIENALANARVKHGEYPDGVNDFANYNISFIR